MASDARVRYTKMVITQSFVKLLKTEPINRITVKQICDLAEINRATFYKHYLDVYDLLEKMEEKFLIELKAVLDSRENNMAKDVLTFIMVKFKEEEDTYKAICSPNGDATFPSKLFEVCYTFSMEHEGLTAKHISDEKKKWCYHFIAHGCNGVLNQWIADGMKEPISGVADFMECLITNTLSAL